MYLLASEMCAESLLFATEAIQWRNACASQLKKRNNSETLGEFTEMYEVTLPDRLPLSTIVKLGDDRAKQAHFIYLKYIEFKSQYEINISNAARKGLSKYFDGFNSSHRLPRTQAQSVNKYRSPKIVKVRTTSTSPVYSNSPHSTTVTALQDQVSNNQPLSETEMESPASTSQPPPNRKLTDMESVGDETPTESVEVSKKKRGQSKSVRINEDKNAVEIGDTMFDQKHMAHQETQAILEVDMVVFDRALLEVFRVMRSKYDTYKVEGRLDKTALKDVNLNNVDKFVINKERAP